MQGISGHNWFTDTGQSNQCNEPLAILFQDSLDKFGDILFSELYVLKFAFSLLYLCMTGEAYKTSFLSFEEWYTDVIVLRH